MSEQEARAVLRGINRRLTRIQKGEYYPQIDVRKDGEGHYVGYSTVSMMYGEAAVDGGAVPSVIVPLGRG